MLSQESTLIRKPTFVPIPVRYMKTENKTNEL